METFVLFADVLELVLVLMRRTTAVCLTIGFRLATALMRCAGEIFGFAEENSSLVFAHGHQTHNDQHLCIGKYLIDVPHFLK